jgi:Protein of unknown function (DUF3558)
VMLAVAAALLTGCTTVVEGTPSAPSGVLLPPRPREVRLDGVDPCSLLTAEQRSQLGFTSEPVASRPYVELFRGDVPTCTMDGPAADPTVLGFGLVTSVGIERWQDGGLAANIRATSIATFPALIALPTQLVAYCAVEVDTAPGQLVDVQLLDGGHVPPLPQEILCARARSSAEEIVKTLAAR